MERLSDWVNTNKLSLNVKKTQYMLFAGRKNINNEQGICINKALINKTDQAKFLGVIITETLSWQSHINYISKKISKSIGIIYKLSKYLNRNTLISLYYSLIYPYMIYCNEVWGLGYTTHKRKLLILQKRALRIICGKLRDDHSNPLYKMLKILKINDINTFLIATFMHKHYNQEIPDIFGDMFTNNSTVHNYDTRQNSELHVPKVKSNLTKMTLRYAGVITWNKIIRNISFKCSIETFKKKIKDEIIGNY